VKEYQQGFQQPFDGTEQQVILATDHMYTHTNTSTYIHEVSIKTKKCASCFTVALATGGELFDIICISGTHMSRHVAFEEPKWLFTFTHASVHHIHARFDSHVVSPCNVELGERKLEFVVPVNIDT
jgi:hypothetical protein